MADTNIQFYTDTRTVFKTSDDTSKVAIGSANGTTQGFEIAYDLLTTPQAFKISPLGVNYTSGITNDTTSLPRLALTGTLLQSVDVPPNPTTLEVNKTLLLTDTISTGSIGIVGTTTQVDASGDLVLNPIGSIKTNGKIINMGGSGEIHQCPLIHSLNNNNITIEGRGTGDVILKTGTTDRLTIADTGAMTFQGGMGYNNTTNTLTATNFTGTVSKSLITDENSGSTYFPVFTAGIGSQSLLIDSSAGPFSIVPSTGDMKLATTMKIDGTKVAFGVNAGLTSQGLTTVAIGNEAGRTSQNANCVAIGNDCASNTQGQGAVAIGTQAGRTSQATNSVAIGIASAYTSQGQAAVAIGQNAGDASQGSNCVAVGVQAGQKNQGQGSVAIGSAAAIGSLTVGQGQGTNAVAIGNTTAQFAQGNNSVSIGVFAGQHTQGIDSVAIGNKAAQGTIGVGQGTRSIAIGSQAALTIQGVDSVAIGSEAGKTSQGDNSIAIGKQAGLTSQLASSVAIGENAGRTNQNIGSVAIGRNSGYNGQGLGSIAIGSYAAGGLTTTQGTGAIAIGDTAGRGTGASGQGNYAISIGKGVGATTCSANSIALIATGVDFAPPSPAFYVDPIRSDATKQNQVQYNTSSKEISYVAQVVSPITTSGFDITGSTGGLFSTTAGAASGSYLKIRINGTDYKINLLNV